MKSMTGYGKASAHIKGYGHVDAEIKTLNGKGLNVNLKMPQEFFEYEFDMRKIISGYFSRGNVTVALSYEYDESYMKKQVANKAELYEKMAGTIKRAELIPIILQEISKDMPQQKKMNRQTADTVISLIRKAAMKADRFRVSEGAQIQKEIKQYAAEMKKAVKTIEKHSKHSVKRKRDRLAGMLNDPEIIADNILAFADKIDIAEEISRFSVHLGKLQVTKSGTKLNFILQEMFREINTIAAKSESIEITESVIKVKEIIEKLKEQVMNIE